MWLAGSKWHVPGAPSVADVYIGNRAIAICEDGERILNECVTSFDQGIAFLQQSLPKLTCSRRLRFWLSGGLCRPYRFEPIQGIKSEVELERIASSMAQRQLGFEPGCVVWMESRSSGQELICAALESSTQTKLLELKGRHRVVSIIPWWSEVLRFAMKSRKEVQLVAVRDCDSLTLLAGSEKNFHTVTTISPLIEGEVAKAAISRLLLTADIAQEREFRVHLDFGRQDNTEPNIAMEFALARYAEIST